jgi:CBS domain-containing protein
MEPTVRDVMSESGFSVDEGLPLVDARDEMNQHGVRTMPVLDTDGRFKGVLLWRDAEEALSRGSQESLTVAEVCRSGISIGPDESINAARALLESEQVGTIPVVDATRPVGVVSGSHIKYFLEWQRQRAALDELRPPDELLTRYSRTADEFFQTGIAGVATLRRLGLQPHHHVLDPGCGVGRMAIALTQYLSPEGRYEGFDVFRDCIEWCSQTITPHYGNFRFTYADVASTVHNPDAEVQSKDYTFPYGDGEFDFVFLISVFTHMLPEGFERYLSEIARVLKTGGRVMATFLLLNDDTLGRIEAAKSPQQPLHDLGDYRLANLARPEDTVAYREDHVRPLFDRLGLEIIEVTRGDWATKEHPAMGTQDAVVAVKTASSASPT